MKLFVGVKGLVHHNGKFLLLRESSKYLDGSEEGKWDVPGGRIESDEELRLGLIREIHEESGLDVVSGDLLGAFDGFPIIRGERCHVVRIYFLCEAHSDTIKHNDDHDAYDWVDPHNFGDKQFMRDIEEMLIEAQKNITKLIPV